MSREAFTSPEIMPPAGPFSHAVRAGDLVYLSGQIGQDAAIGRLVDGGVAAETAQILSNCAHALAAVGLDLSRVVKCNVYLADMRDFATMNEIYARHFTAPYPARTTVGVAALPLGARVEIEMIAR